MVLQKQLRRGSVGSKMRNQQLTWMYLNALLSTLRLEVFFSSILGMFFFRVSKHSFKCARLTDTTHDK